MIRQLRRLLFFFVFCVLGACAGSSSTVASGDGPYALTPEQADAVIRQSVEEGWPNKDYEPLEDGRIGYQFKVWFAVDHDNVHAVAESVGHNLYEFSVWNTGTAPASGNPARQEFLNLIVKNAGIASR